jgi:hypothetical protein
MNECKVKKIWSMLFVFGFMIIMPFSAFATAIDPLVEEALIDIIDPITGDVLRTDNYTDVLNALVHIEGDVSSFVYSSEGIVIDGMETYDIAFSLAVDPDPWYVWDVNLFNSSTKYIRVHTETFSGHFTEPVGAHPKVSSHMGGLIRDMALDGVRVEPVNQDHIAVTELFSDSHNGVNLGIDAGNAFELSGIDYMNPANSGMLLEGNPDEVKHLAYDSDGNPIYTGMFTYSKNILPYPGPSPAPDELWNGFRTTISFSVTPWDSANFNGKVNIEPTSAPASHTPEPSTLFLIGAGLVMVGLVAWRRKRQS